MQSTCSVAKEYEEIFSQIWHLTWKYEVCFLLINFGHKIILYFHAFLWIAYVQNSSFLGTKHSCNRRALVQRWWIFNPQNGDLKYEQHRYKYTQHWVIVYWKRNCYLNVILQICKVNKQWHEHKHMHRHLWFPLLFTKPATSPITLASNKAKVTFHTTNSPIYCVT